MKIGMVSEFYYPQPGGISEHIRALSRELTALGHEVVVISSHIDGDIQEREPRVIRLGRSIPVHYNGSLSRVSAGWRLGPRFDAMLAAEKFDLLHIHNPMMPTLPLLTLSRAKCPLVGTFHSFYPRDLLAMLFKPFLSPLLNRLDARIAVSPAAESAAGDIFPGDFEVIPNGVDFKRFSSSMNCTDKTLLGLDENNMKILFVGAMVKRKGLPCLLKAFEILCDQRDDIELLVIGDGPDRSRIQKALPASIRESVHFVGFVPRQKLVEYYGNADIFCAPSLGRESFGMVLLEGMAAKLPVVGFDIDGYRDVVEHGRDGLLVEHGNTVALARALDYFLDHPDVRQAYAERGQIKAAGLAWSEIALRIDAVYNRVLGIPAVDVPSDPQLAKRAAGV
ncbi:MAG: glycosyltransferase family 4 protein [bacterium]|nr:glycosyltransferase family 4 protein [bacterium]